MGNWTQVVPAPMQVWRGWGCATQVEAPYLGLGDRVLVIGGARTLGQFRPALERHLEKLGLEAIWASYGVDCAEPELARLRELAAACTGILGVGGGKALDTAKLVGEQGRIPVVTIPTSAATCAGWTALSNVYGTDGAFAYDVPLSRAPQALIVDYAWIATAPARTLRAGIGDALAKWYEASVSSGAAQDALVISAVQQARVLRDLLFQTSAQALGDPGGDAWVQVVDACVCLAGVIGGLGGARCRTVAAHAVHNGLTHLPGSRLSLHGEKVAVGILVQLRLEELVQGSQLAAAARRELLRFYGEIGLPTRLEELFQRSLMPEEIQRAAQIACLPSSDIHHLPFPVTPELVATAMQTTLSGEPLAQAVGHS
ncbi:MAG: iron-containing alcohol dehydrogenase family protein [Thermostichales cyanobacterium DRC_bins_46]